MEISLIRHGKSKHIENNRVTCKEFVKWVEKYDDSGVFEKGLSVRNIEKNSNSKHRDHK